MTDGPMTEHPFLANQSGRQMAADEDAAPMQFTEEYATFGDRLQAARQGAGLRRKDLARQIGIKTATLRNWEDDRSAPRAQRLIILAGILGVSLVWLMTGQGEGAAAEIFEDDAGDPGVRAARIKAIGALVADFSAARRSLSEANRKLAGIERRIARLARG